MENIASENNRRRKKINIHGPVVIRSTLEVIPDIGSLELLGVGIDGYVFRHKDKAIKILKGDIPQRKAKDLMTFEKANYFIQNLHLRRIVHPTDIILNTDGVYVGYVMPFLHDVTKDMTSPYYNKPGKFSMGQLCQSIDELENDISALSSKNVVMEDLNRGSYIYTKDFMHMCDTDKFHVSQNHTGITFINLRLFQFFVSKGLYLMMYGSRQFSKDQLKILSKWVKKSSNSSTFLKEIREDCDSEQERQIGDYAIDRARRVLARR